MQSKMIFCTLFDSYYLDKGIALYRSLERTANNRFRLYVFCFDDKSYDILDSMNFEHMVLIKSSVLDNETMNRLKLERSKAEYCWTCTPQVVEYVLDHFEEDNATYIDADLYFFSDPQPLFDEIATAKANTVILEHRFDECIRGRRMLRRSGKYCVEFNYFDQSPESRKALKWWKEKCIEWCYHIYEPERMGDQKYLEKFPKLFDGVYELQHLGAGVAPWNLSQYKLLSETDNDSNIILSESRTGNSFPLVFYHFQNIRYIGKNMVNVYSGTYDKKLKDAIYIPYLVEIEIIRKRLLSYDITFSAKKAYSSNKIMALFQKTILRFKIRSLSDVYNLRTIMATYDKSN